MQNLQKSIKSYLSSAMIYAVAMAILGVILLIFPEFSLDFIRWSLAIILIALGAWRIAGSLTSKFGTGTFGGIILLIMGIIIAAHPDVLNIIPIILGIWMILSGFYSLRLATGLRGSATGSFIVSLLTSSISIIAGLLLIINPYSSVALTAFIGIMLIIFAASSLIDMIVLRSHLKNIAKYVNGHKIIEVKVKKK